MNEPLQRPWDGSSQPVSSTAKPPAAMDAWVGARLRMRRLELGWSLEHLAREVGVSHQQARKWETGETRMVAGRIYDVAQALEVHPGYFFDGNQALQVQTSMAADLRSVTTAAGIGMLTAFNRLLPEQRNAISLIVDAFEKANHAERTIGPDAIAQQGTTTEDD